MCRRPYVFHHGASRRSLQARHPAARRGVKVHFFISPRALVAHSCGAHAILRRASRSTRTAQWRPCTAPPALGGPPPEAHTAVCAQIWDCVSVQISARWPHTATAHTRLCGAHLAARGGHSGGPERLRQRWGERSPGAHAVHCRPMRGESDLHARLHDGPAQLRRAREPGERLALHLLGTTASPGGTASAGGEISEAPGSQRCSWCTAQWGREFPRNGGVVHTPACAHCPQWVAAAALAFDAE